MALDETTRSRFYVNNGVVHEMARRGDRLFCQAP